MKLSPNEFRQVPFTKFVDIYISWPENKDLEDEETENEDSEDEEVKGEEPEDKKKREAKVLEDIRRRFFRRPRWEPELEPEPTFDCKLNPKNNEDNDDKVVAMSSLSIGSPQPEIPCQDVILLRGCGEVVIQCLILVN